MGADNIIPKDKWVFDKEVVDVFDSMLTNSIPDIDGLRNWICRFLRPFAGHRLQLLDVGASVGGTFSYIQNRLRDNSLRDSITFSATLIENSPEMFVELRTRFGNDENVSAFDLDILRYLQVITPAAPFDVVLSVLTQMFLPIEIRFEVLSRIHKIMSPTGKFFIVEKTFGETFISDINTTAAYYEFKREQGYTWEAIQAKRKSLQNVLVPTKASWCEELYRDCGFDVNRFWQNGPFVGWLLTPRK